MPLDPTTAQQMILAEVGGSITLGSTPEPATLNVVDSYLAEKRHLQRSVWTQSPIRLYETRLHPLPHRPVPVHDECRRRRPEPEPPPAVREPAPDGEGRDGGGPVLDGPVHQPATRSPRLLSGGGSPRRRSPCCFDPNSRRLSGTPYFDLGSPGRSQERWTQSSRRRPATGNPNYNPITQGVSLSTIFWMKQHLVTLLNQIAFNEGRDKTGVITSQYQVNAAFVDVLCCATGGGISAAMKNERWESDQMATIYTDDRASSEDPGHAFYLYGNVFEIDSVDQDGNNPVCWKIHGVRIKYPDALIRGLQADIPGRSSERGYGGLDAHHDSGRVGQSHRWG